MNNILEVIKERRSIRRYLPNQITEEELNLILEAAVYAPSGHNDQPWHFTVIQNKEIIDDINNSTKAFMKNATTDWILKMANNENYHIFHNAPTVVIVSGDESNNKDIPYCPISDCSAAVQNMMLVAQSIGVASCWVGLTSFLFEKEEELTKLNLPEGYKPQFAVTFGYSAITKEIKPFPRRENVVTIIK